MKNPLLQKFNTKYTTAPFSQIKTEHFKPAFKEAIKIAKAEIDVIKVDVKTAMWKEKIDLAEVNKLIDKKYNAKAKLAKTYVKAVSDIQGVLSAEQLSQLHEMKVQAKLTKDCKKCGHDKKCTKCAAKSGGKFCPITGKPLDTAGYDKGSMK